MPKPTPKPKAKPKVSEEDAYFAELQARMKPRLQATPVSPFAPKVDPAEEKRKKADAKKTKALGQATSGKLGGGLRGRNKNLNKTMDNF